MKRLLWIAVTVASIGCGEDDPPSFYESPNLRGPIAVGDDAIYFLESNQRYMLTLAELGLDGVRRGLVTTDTLVSDVEVRGATLAWTTSYRARRSGPRAGDETVMLPSSEFRPSMGIALTEDGMFFRAQSENPIDKVIFYWGDAGLEQLPLGPERLGLVGADSSSVYVVLGPSNQLVRYARIDGVIEPIAEGVDRATLTGDRILYATADALFEREIATGIERRLHERPGDLRGGFLVAAGNVVFWGNRRIMNGRMEEFLLSGSSSRYLQGVEVNGTDVYWLTRAYAGPSLIGEDPDIRLHRAAIDGPRPF